MQHKRYNNIRELLVIAVILEQGKMFHGFHCGHFHQVISNSCPSQAAACKKPLGTKSEHVTLESSTNAGV